MLRRGLPGLAGQSLKQGGRVVDQHSRAFIGIDTSKLRNAVAVAEEGRDGEVRYLGEIDTTEAATQARHQTCGQIPSTDVLLRGWADGIRAPSVDREAWPRLHRGGPLADPKETWRSGEDEPSRCSRPRQAIARRGTHRGLGA